MAGVRFKSVLTCAVICSVAAASWGMFSVAANAQSRENRSSSDQIRFETVPEAFDRVVTRNSRDYFTNLTIPRQLDILFLGVGTPVTGTFAENEIAEDARLTAILYLDVLKQQVSTTPLIRTPDINNPYDSSILLNPLFGRRRVVGSELVYERSPLP